jgi:putative acetyltransferase
MKTRRFDVEDIAGMIRLFRDTVHRVCCNDYDSAQLLAWAPEHIDENKWTRRFQESFTLIAEEHGILVGFANLENDGTIDMLYVHADWQRKGVAKILYESIEIEAKRLKLKRLTSDVSITARNFFLGQGFQIDGPNVKEVRGLVFNNAFMSKSLLDPDRH